MNISNQASVVSDSDTNNIRNSEPAIIRPQTTEANNPKSESALIDDICSTCHSSSFTSSNNDSHTLIDVLDPSPLIDPLINIIHSSVQDPLSPNNLNEIKSFTANSSSLSSDLIARVSNAAPKRTALKFKDKEHLNWSDMDELRNYQSLLDDSQTSLLKLAHKKQTDYTDNFDKGFYFQNLPFLITSNYGRAQSVLCCGRTIKGVKIPCNQWSFCSKCAYKRGIAFYHQFIGAFRKYSFHHITLSFDGDIGFDALDAVNAREYWDANTRAIREVISDKIIAGAYLVHEISIRSFLPLRVVPHSHVIIVADEIPSDIADLITGVDLKPSIKSTTIKDDDDFKYMSCYLTKEFNLEKYYLSAWRAHVEGDESREHAPALNYQMKVFLDSWDIARNGYSRVLYMGNLRPQNKKIFIGTEKPKKPKTKKTKRKKKFVS